jgi:hypothetical protein
MRDAKNAASVLARDVETAQKAYETAQARYIVNKVESGARSANITILNDATEPVEPARRRCCSTSRSASGGPRCSGSRPCS